jgi:hypothetical protein
LEFGRCNISSTDSVFCNRMKQIKRDAFIQKEDHVVLHFVLGLISFLFYLANRFVFKPLLINGSGMISEIIRYHVNDYLGSFLMCSYINIVMYYFNGRLIRVNLLHYVLIGIMCSIFWEVLAPFVLKYSTPDILDCIAYILGTISYYCLIKINR